MASTKAGGGDIHVVQEIEVVHERTSDELKDPSISRPVQSSNETVPRDTRNLIDRHYWLPGRLETSTERESGKQPRGKMKVQEAFRLFPKAVAWSCVVLLTVVMEAYGKSLISNFYALPAFRKAFGSLNTGAKIEDYQVSPVWQSSLQNGQVCGEVIGLFIFGMVTDHVGYKNMMAATLGWTCVSVLVAFVAPSLAIIVFSQVLNGLSWGVLETMAATYAADILPVALRGLVLSNVNMCWLIGQLIGATTVRMFLRNASPWAWRIPFSIQWIWAVPLLFVCLCAPESPWWLVRHGNNDAAYQSLLRLTSSAFTGCHQTIAMMTETNQQELRFDSAKPSFKECFEGTNLRRTMLVAMVWITQAMCGSTLTGYAPYFYEQAGMDSQRAFSISMGMYGMGILGNMVAWILLQHVGRRRLYLWGLSCSFTLLLTGGVISVLPLQQVAMMWTLGSLIILTTFIYDMTIGPVCYVLVTEIPSTRLRLRTVVIARIFYNLALLVNNLLAPRMLDPGAWDWKGRTCFVFAGTCLLCLGWTYLYLPETWKLGHIEMDILFSKNAPANKFKMFQERLEGSGYVSIRMMENMAGRWHGTQGFA